MNKQTEALKLALECIEKLWNIIDDIDTYGDMAKADEKLYRSLVERRQRTRFEETGISTDGYTLDGGAITAIREALAEQPAQQPVAWSPRLDYSGYADKRVWANGKPKQEDIEYWSKNGGGVDVAYTSPQPAQQPEPCQCPECQVTPHASDCAVHNEPAYPNGACNCRAQQWNAGVPSLYPEPEPGVSIKATYEQPAQQQEPVAWLIWLHGPAGHFDHKQFAELEFERRNKEYPDPDRKLLPLYTSPPASKPWVALTDEEKNQVAWSCGSMSADWLEFADAIEAKLKEKNA